MAANRKQNLVDIEVSEAQIAQIERDVAGIKNGVPRVIVGAINKVLPKGRTIVVDRLWELLAIKKRKNVLDRTAVTKASAGKPVGVVRILGRRIGLINFNVKDTRNKRTRMGQGVTAQAYRGGPVERFPKAFIATGQQGNKHVFERVKGAKRLPIFARKGLSLFDVATRDHPEIVAESKERIQAELGKDLASQVDRLLKRKKADRPD